MATSKDTRELRSQERLRLTLRMTRSGYWEHDIQSQTDWWSDELYHILGIEPGTLPPGRPTVMRLVVPEDVPGLDAAYARSVETGQLQDHVFRIVTPAGEERRILVTGEIQLDEAGTPVTMAGILMDVTEQARAEAAVLESEVRLHRAHSRLRASEERYRAIVETTTEWIWEIDLEGRHIYSNPEVERMLGYGAQDFLTLDTFDLIHEDDREWVRERLQQSRESKKGWSGLVIRWLHKDGQYRYLESNARPILDARGTLTGYRGADRDITERRQMQERLLVSQKLEAIGQLAAGIAHDFNNHLVVILGSSEILLEQAPPDLLEEVEEIRHAGERASALTQQLLAFGRRQVMRPRAIDLNDVVEGVRQLLSRLIEENIDLVIDLAPEPVPVLADPTQVEQVVVNLATNARDAMPSGGTLTIRTTTHAGEDSSRSVLDSLPEGPCAVLTVVDTGKGMAAEVAALAFEPFFTTKPTEQGTGLGLSTVYGIIQQSGGDVTIHTTPGRGTSVSVYLPITSEKPVGLERPQLEVRGGTERILMVDDEPLVASTMAKVLRRAGYEVVVATDSLQATRQGDSPFDLLITDMVMPGMNGTELARNLTDENPDLKVIFASGYPPAGRMAPRSLGSRQDYLQKPFSTAQLLTRIRQLLDP